MSLKIRIQPLADNDLDNHAGYIAKDNLSAALRLYEAAEVTFAFLADTPFVGAPCSFDVPEVKDLRIWRIKGFPKYLIFYRVTKEAVVIVRIIHAAQNRDRIFKN